MDLDRLLSAPPVPHVDHSGRPVQIAASDDVLRFIEAHVGRRSRTLETGVGLSTILFAMKGADLTCVAPGAAEIERVKVWCAGAGVSTDRVTFCEARSENALPTLGASALDLVLIDGAHGFPSPFIDWYYAGRRLGRGGLLVVDDTQLWTGRVLRAFLLEEPGWEMVDDLAMRTAIFRRTRDPEELSEWGHQPFVARRSYEHGAKGFFRRSSRGWDLARRHGAWELVRRVRRSARR